MVRYTNDDGYQARLPQDDLDWTDEDTDPIIREENEDMTEIMHVDPEERREIMREDEDVESEQAEDYREELEDRDQET